jgi:hypothetical protein
MRHPSVASRALNAALKQRGDDRCRGRDEDQGEWRRISSVSR